jgi:hypothetical protein
LGSILEAYRLAIKRSKKKKRAKTNKKYNGYIKKPPFCNISHIEIFSSTGGMLAAVLCNESTIGVVVTYNK